jgi:AcrR family transcriptional regulator
MLYHSYAILVAVTRSEAADNAMRTALIEAAARLIATEGVQGLTLRRVADEVGTSTMAIYTHFGGMSELRRAVRREGFARLAARGAQVGETEDPVADLATLGREYYEHAMSNPDLYRVMYMQEPLDADDAAARADTFDLVVTGMRRCIESGRFAPADPSVLATQFWAVGHGVVTLELAHLLSSEEALRCVAGALVSLFTGYGDDPEAARRSILRARPAAGPDVEPAAA